jgi:ribosomal protein L12E/L44/L45/RPP1/RPP2
MIRTNITQKERILLVLQLDELSTSLDCFAKFFSCTKMSLSFQVSGADKDQLVTSLAAIILSDSGAEITADSINAVVSASGNNVPAYYPTLYASFIEKAGGVDKFFAAPSAGGTMCFIVLLILQLFITVLSPHFRTGAPSGGAAPAAASGAAPAAKKEEKPKVEEVDALDGGMDMFGGGGAKTGDY